MTHRKPPGPEEILQRAVADWLMLQTTPGFTWNAINPCPAKSKAAAGKSKAMGLRAGWPDMMFVWRGRPFCIELKAKRGYQSADQKALCAEIEAAGCMCFVARSLEEVIGIVAGMGVPVRGRVAA